MNSLLRAKNLHKTFNQVAAVRDVSLEVAPTDFLAIIGRSGSGKTTTLHLLAGLEAPDSGKILFQGQDISQLDEDALALWRREHVGLVFQPFVDPFIDEGPRQFLHDQHDGDSANEKANTDVDEGGACQ